MSQWRERIVPVIINVLKFFPGLMISFLAAPIINNVMAAKMPRMATIQNGDTFSLPYRAALPKMMAAMLMAIRPFVCSDIILGFHAKAPRCAKAQTKTCKEILTGSISKNNKPDALIVMMQINLRSV